MIFHMAPGVFSDSPIANSFTSIYAVTMKHLERTYTRTEIGSIMRSLGESLPSQGTFWQWTKGPRAFLRPAVKGSGTIGDSWDVAAVVLVRWVCLLRRQEVPLQRIRKAFSYLRRELPAVLEDPHPWAFCVSAGRDPLLVRRGDEIGMELVTLPGQAVFLDAVSARETAKAAERFAIERERAAA